MLIGELSRRTSVSTRLLRYYDEQGLITSRRLPNGYRDFPEDAPETVARIRGLLSAGLSTEVIRELLPCAEGTAPKLEACPSVIGALRAEAEGMQRRIEALSRSREAVLRYIAEARPAPEEAAEAASASR
ncbi:MerR family transcriptional regulator [Streptomonospora nanhaiensis]|uniref:MerR family transcriptional regulator n=1 Tax=Streptomonospora nanhaiensis TaxID=1323731 RepID=UPI001C385D74|nr:MerR family transcriptional regulator [Streptomonospora nanhaiensis]MBV2362240.1 MerR family transcriptional regulator [Streptomonospora nanhaiensis]